ncbi:MAG TPA: SDR family oxidoreductase [Allosphingosinicella sp.]|jgi:NAD(P)-dependent dehydrogenase (short-subunit alcohol dehydrogenase family)
MLFRDDLLCGRVALVTGGGSGIGLQLARGIGKVGARVIIAARNEGRLRSAVELLKGEGIDASYELLDIRDDVLVDTVVARIVDKHAGLDILVNNAGGQFPSKAESISPRGWRSVIDVCLNGTFYMCRAVGQHMIDREAGGKILNISASCIERGSPGIAHSGAARAAVSHLTQTLAREWAQFGIQVNALGPQYLSEGAADNLGGAVADFIPSVTPAGRWATDEELQNWGAALVSPLYDYVTGTTLYLDGGNWLGEGIVYRGSSVCPE